MGEDNGMEKEYVMGEEHRVEDEHVKDEEHGVGQEHMVEDEHGWYKSMGLEKRAHTNREYPYLVIAACLVIN